MKRITLTSRSPRDWLYGDTLAMGWGVWRVCWVGYDAIYVRRAGVVSHLKYWFRRIARRA